MDEVFKEVVVEKVSKKLEYKENDDTSGSESITKFLDVVIKENEVMVEVG